MSVKVFISPLTRTARKNGKVLKSISKIDINETVDYYQRCSRHVYIDLLHAWAKFLYDTIKCLFSQFS